MTTKNHLAYLKAEFEALKKQVHEAPAEQRPALVAEVWKLEDAIKKEVNRMTRRWRNPGPATAGAILERMR